MSWQDLGVVIGSVIGVRIFDYWKAWLAERRENKENPYFWVCLVCRENGNNFFCRSNHPAATDQMIRRHEKEVHGR